MTVRPELVEGLSHSPQPKTGQGFDGLSPDGGVGVTA